MAMANKSTVTTKLFRLPYDRAQNKELATTMAMLMIWRFVHGEL